MTYVKPDLDTRTQEQKGDDRVRLLKLAADALAGADLEDVCFVGAELAGFAVARYATACGNDVQLFADALTETSKLLTEVAQREFAEPGPNTAQDESRV